jgi:hypothetical protein
MKRRRNTKEQKEAALLGRLDTPALRAALEEVLRYVDIIINENLRLVLSLFKIFSKRLFLGADLK